MANGTEPARLPGREPEGKDRAKSRTPRKRGVDEPHRPQTCQVSRLFTVSYLFRFVFLVCAKLTVRPQAERLQFLVFVLIPKHLSRPLVGPRLGQPLRP